MDCVTTCIRAARICKCTFLRTVVAAPMRYVQLIERNKPMSCYDGTYVHTIRIDVNDYVRDAR